jgi:5-oxoprolinase (ATP-hydrolysing) subunit A
MRFDLNCDMGEGMQSDEALMPYINSANIACGYHAGTESLMRSTIVLCLKYNVAIGAHPSFDDKADFGRKEMQLSEAEIYQLVTDQIIALQSIAHEFKVELHHVKPHGALYNMAARDQKIAAAIAAAVRSQDEDLELYGLSGSYLVSEAKAIGLKTKSEVFADRTYQHDGSLTPRSQPGALINEEEAAVQQVLQMVKDGTVTTVGGKVVPIVAETICIHGDGPHAVPFAKAISLKLKG